MRKLIAIFILTLLVYLAAAYLSIPVSNFDSQSYNQIGVLSLKGINIYPDPAISRHPYLPLFLFLEAGTLFLSHIVHIPHVFLLKCLFSLFHLLSIYVVYYLSKKNGKTTLFYALNPVSLLIIAFHGQFDIIPLFLLLSSLLLLKKRKYTAIMLHLGLAFTIKTWPILFIIPFLKRVPKKYWIWFFLPPFLTVLLYSIFFHASPIQIVRVLIVYQGVGSIWGLGKILSLISTQKIFLFCYKIFFVAGILFYSIKQKKKLIVNELYKLLFLFFLFTPGFGLQWFLWLTPFFFLSKKPYIYVFIAAITICLCVSYLTWTPFTIIHPQTAYFVLFLLWPIFILYFLFFFLFPKVKYMS
ncbi:MAG: hypothetical protein V1922_06120 [bacterium]